MVTQPEYWSRRQAQAAAGLTYSATRKWVERGLVRAKTISGRPCLLRADVEALIVTRQNVAPRGVTQHSDKTKRKMARLAKQRWAARRQHADAR